MSVCLFVCVLFHHSPQTSEWLCNRAQVMRATLRAILFIALRRSMASPDQRPTSAAMRDMTGMAVLNFFSANSKFFHSDVKNAEHLESVAKEGDGEGEGEREREREGEGEKK